MTLNTRRRLLAVIILGHLCLLGACSIQQADVRRGGESMDPAAMLVRLHDVAFPLLVAAAELCPFEQEPTYGFFLKDRQTSQAGGERTELGASVAYVHPQLPAALAGLVPDDQLISVNERTVTGSRGEEVSQLIRRLTVARIQPL